MKVRRAGEVLNYRVTEGTESGRGGADRKHNHCFHPYNYKRACIVWLQQFCSAMQNAAWCGMFSEDRNCFCLVLLMITKTCHEMAILCNRIELFKLDTTNLFVSVSVKTTPMFFVLSVLLFRSELSELGASVVQYYVCFPFLLCASAPLREIFFCFCFLFSIGY